MEDATWTGSPTAGRVDLLSQAAGDPHRHVIRVGEDHPECFFPHAHNGIGLDTPSLFWLYHIIVVIITSIIRRLKILILIDILEGFETLSV